MIAQNVLFWLQIGALAFLTSLAVSGFMVVAGLGDASDGRSAHRGTVPTSGGVGFVAGMGVALCAMALLFPDLNLPSGFAPVMSLFFGVALLGLVDDALTLGAKTKFGLMILICGAAVWVIGSPEFHGRGQWHDGSVTGDCQCWIIWGWTDWRLCHDTLNFGLITHDYFGFFTL